MEWKLIFKWLIHSEMQKKKASDSSRMLPNKENTMLLMEASSSNNNNSSSNLKTKPIQTISQITMEQLMDMGMVLIMLRVL